MGQLEIELKSPEQIRLMRAAGLVVADTLALLREAAAPGVSTADLDAIAEESIRRTGAIPSFKGYHGYPASICSSVNDQVVHAIPSPAFEGKEASANPAMNHFCIEITKDFDEAGMASIALHELTHSL